MLLTILYIVWINTPNRLRHIFSQFISSISSLDLFPFHIIFRIFILFVFFLSYTYHSSTPIKLYSFWHYNPPTMFSLMLFSTTLHYVQYTPHHILFAIKFSNSIFLFLTQVFPCCLRIHLIHSTNVTKPSPPLHPACLIHIKLNIIIFSSFNLIPHFHCVLLYFGGILNER